MLVFIIPLDLPGCHVGSFALSDDIHCEFESAAIASPKYPYPYPPSTRLTWHITTSPATYIELLFYDFDVPSGQSCEYDYVIVF